MTCIDSATYPPILSISIKFKVFYMVHIHWLIVCHVICIVNHIFQKNITYFAIKLVHTKFVITMLNITI